MDVPTTLVSHRSAACRLMALLEDSGTVRAVVHKAAGLDPTLDSWEEFLREQAHISALAMEFQTGLRSPNRAKEYIRQLEKLQQSVQRPLSLVAVGAARYVGPLVKVFAGRLTVVDSNPFMKAMWRRGTNVIGPLSMEWIARHTHENEPVDSLLWENVTSYEARLELRAGRAHSKETGQIAA